MWLARVARVCPGLTEPVARTAHWHAMRTRVLAMCRGARCHCLMDGAMYGARTPGRLKDFGVAATALRPTKKSNCLMLGDEVCFVGGAALRPRRPSVETGDTDAAGLAEAASRLAWNRAKTIRQTRNKIGNQQQLAGAGISLELEDAFVDEGPARSDDSTLSITPQSNAQSSRIKGLNFRHSWPNSSTIACAMPGGRFDEDVDDTSYSTIQHSLFKINDLEVGATLGEGFFGRVYLAKHRRTGHTVVVKELKESDSEAETAFIHEVSLLRNLSHPNLLNFMGLFAAGDTLQMVTEFIDGGTLEDVIDGTKEEYKVLTWDFRVQLAMDLCSGMAYLHERRVIHRDLKPENCLMKTKPHTTLVVADFGLASTPHIITSLPSFQNDSKFGLYTPKAVTYHEPTVL